jgi:hypothetical protein
MYWVARPLRGHKVKKTSTHVRLEQLYKSDVPEHSVDFHNTSILTTKTRYMDRVVREAIETELQPNNMKRQVGFCLSKSCQPLIWPLEKSPYHDAISTRLRTSYTIESTFLETTGFMLLRQPWTILTPTPTLFLLWQAPCYLLAWPSYELFPAHSPFPIHFPYSPFSRPLFSYSYCYCY